MKTFVIDLYIWNNDLSDWLLIPARGAALQWPAFPGISQAALLVSDAGITFRVDDVLWLGNERDGFPLEMVVYSLYNTIGGGTPGELLANMATNEFSSLEIRQGADQHHVLLSRWSTRDAPDDYLEQTARHVGSYCRDFPVESRLWEAAVTAALGGLADALIASPLPGPEPENEGLANWLLKNYGPTNEST